MGESITLEISGKEYKSENKRERIKKKRRRIKNTKPRPKKKAKCLSWSAGCVGNLKNAYTPASAEIASIGLHLRRRPPPRRRRPRPCKPWRVMEYAPAAAVMG